MSCEVKQQKKSIEVMLFLSKFPNMIVLDAGWEKNNSKSKRTEKFNLGLAPSTSV